jgi:hypothetical protein
MQCRRLWFNSWVGKFSWRRHRLLTPVFLGFPGGSDGKESSGNVGDPGSILPWSSTWHPYPRLDNRMDRGACGLQFMGSQRVRRDSGTNNNSNNLSSRLKRNLATCQEGRETSVSVYEQPVAAAVTNCSHSGILNVLPVSFLSPWC